MMPDCMVCGKTMEAGQLRSGLIIEEGEEELSGHYLCVIDALKARDPALALKALQEGLLPTYDPKTIRNGRLEKFQSGMPTPQYAVEEQAFRQALRTTDRAEEN